MGLWTMNADGTDLKPLLSPDAEHAALRRPLVAGRQERSFSSTTSCRAPTASCRSTPSTPTARDSKVLIPHKAFEESPRWSPDGKRIAWVSTRDGNQEIYTVDADGKNIKRLTSETALDNNPELVARRQADRLRQRPHRQLRDPRHERRRQQRPPADRTIRAMDYWPAWSPDGKRIAFTSNRDGNYEIYVMNADGTGLRNLTRHPAQDNYAAWSPDGKRIAFISNRDGGHDVYVMEVK